MPTLYDRVEQLTRLTLSEFGFNIPADLNIDKAKLIMADAQKMGLFFELISDKADPRHFIFEVTLHKETVLRQDIVVGG